MLKKFSCLGLAALFCVAATSCSVEKSSSLEFSVPESFVRSVTSENAGTWTLNIALSGGYSQTRSFSISKPLEGVSSGPFSFEGLPVGAKVTVNAEIYNGELLKYKNEQDYSVELSAGDNAVAVELVRVRADASINGLCAEDFFVRGISEIDTDFQYDNNPQGADGEKIPDLPYDGGKYTFTLVCAGDFYFDFAACTYEWYLNGKKLSGFDKYEIQCDLKELENLALTQKGSETEDGTVEKTVNSFVVFIKSGEEVLAVEYKFTVSEQSSE